METFRFILNPFTRKMRAANAPQPLPSDSIAFHKTLPGYATTPLVTLPDLAKSLGTAAVYVKDESYRFGLNAFKSLGASFAVYSWLQKQHTARFGKRFTPSEFVSGEVTKRIGPVTFTTATDGNHGRAVAWTARFIGQKAVIFMPKGSVPARIDAIRKLGAEVNIVDGDYDQAVRTAAREAEKHGRQVISDTSWPGYTEIPGWIQLGYYTLLCEVDDEVASRSDKAPTIVFVQAGVGALAAAVGAYYANVPHHKRPVLVSVEPTGAACMLESAEIADGKPHTSRGSGKTIMAGLNCATPSMIAWPVIMSAFDAFIAVDDAWAEKAMRSLARPAAGDPPVTSGESGAAGMAALLALMSDEAPRDTRKCLHLTKSSRVLVISTEGATDPDNCARIISGAPK